MQTLSPHVAILTPAGRGAVAVVAVWGGEALSLVETHFRANQGLPLRGRALQQIAYGRWGTEPSEDVIACRRSNNEVEIHCHGGAVAAVRIVGDLVAAGAREQPWTAWIESRETSTRRSEARTALAAATTQRTAKILLDQYHGALETELRAIMAELHANRLSTARDRLETLRNRAAIGLHLTVPWKVVIAGPPNVGKSSLINALVGYQRSIVFDQPGTTRDVVTAHTALDGWPIELSDTAGLRETTDQLEAEGIARATAQAAAADMLILLFDATQPPTREDERLRERWPSALCVLNKCDMVPPASNDNLPSLRHSSGDGSGVRGFLSISALTGAGIPQLCANIVWQLIPVAPPPGQAVPFTPRQIAALDAALIALEEKQLEQTAAAMLALLA